MIAAQAESAAARATPSGGAAAPTAAVIATTPVTQPCPRGDVAPIPGSLAVAGRAVHPVLPGDAVTCLPGTIPASAATSARIGDVVAPSTGVERRAVAPPSARAGNTVAPPARVNEREPVSSAPPARKRTHFLPVERDRYASIASPSVLQSTKLM